ncbi:MAG TPA: GMC family oxidoreductase [Candidatus Acidoferrales bacterium]|nr:GMC family oxidoreductase [Candidatus Acidoferrales bacterium]
MAGKGMSLRRVNAVVVGGGAGGGIVAKELAEAGLSVVLLERGRWCTPYDDRKDDLRNQRTCVLGNSFGPEEKRNPRVIVDANGREQVVLPNQGAYNNNAACVGGGTLSYGAMAWRFLEKDFRLRSTYGAVAGSTLDDWPISYADLEPFYEKAEWEIGVSGDDSNNIFRAPRRRPLPMPPLPPNLEYQILKPAAERLGLHPFDLPMLRNSVPFNGRGACMRCRWCVGFACEVDAKCGTQNTVIPKAIQTGNCELRTECIAKEVLTNDRGNATGVSYFDSDGRLQEQPADLVVVSGAAIESARLLLNSKSRLFPNGLGNRYDWVGRNLQGHAYTGAAGLFEQETYDDLGPGASIALCDFNHGNPGFVGGGLLANEFIRLPYQFARLGGPGIPRWGAAHKEFMRQYYRRSIYVMGPVQEMPVFESRVEVDPKVKDYWGIPVARLSGHRHENDLLGTKFLSSKAELWLKEAGATTTIPFNWISRDGPSGGQHQAGTCRMGNDPRTSVVDKFCRVHDVDNLYVIDGSVHVNNGGFNPVLTIMAVAYYASEILMKNWKGTQGRA